MLVVPPPNRIAKPFDKIAADCPENLTDYVELSSPTDKKGRYLHYDELRFRLPKKLDSRLAWSVIKLARDKQRNPIIQLGASEKGCGFFLTATIQKAISETDQYATTASLQWMLSKMGEQQHLTHLFNDWVQDEAISSSQLEGAATTTKVAKELLTQHRQPRTLDERMILGNFEMMVFIWNNRAEDLSLNLILDLHQRGVNAIKDEQYYPGELRQSDDVVVVDTKGNILHKPPPVAGLEQRLHALVAWANDEDSHSINSERYVHPLVKAIALHFAIGYEHPFRDGNGRVARALFYWYLFKHGFPAFRYIAISTLLKAAPAQYGKSYLHTETDEMDLTYFVDYQCSVILRAIAAFKQTYADALKNIELFNQWLQTSGLDKQLDDRQKIVLQIARSRANQSFTTTSIQENLGCSYNTAAKVLSSLVSLNLFQKEKFGREWRFSMVDNP